MNIENFRETFIAHARDEIKILVSSSKIKGEFDCTVFNEQLLMIWSEAQINGLTEFEFTTIIEEVMPAHFESVILPYHSYPMAA